MREVCEVDLLAAPNNKGLSVWGAMWSAVVAPLVGLLHHGKLSKKVLALTNRKVSSWDNGGACNGVTGLVRVGEWQRVTEGGD